MGRVGTSGYSEQRGQNNKFSTSISMRVEGEFIYSFMNLFNYYCYQTQVRLVSAQMIIIKRQVSVERKDVLIRKPGNLGRRWTHVPRPTLKILLSYESFEREKGGKTADSSDVTLPM